LPIHAPVLSARSTIACAVFSAESACPHSEAIFTVLAAASTLAWATL
jgi:hypothetical protein